MHIAVVNLLIEHYSPVGGGAISTCIYEQARHLIARGHRVSVLTRVDQHRSYDVGDVIAVDAPERHKLSAGVRVLHRLQNRWQRWDWPYYCKYVNAVEHALNGMAHAPDLVLTHNDLQLGPRLRCRGSRTPIAAYVHNLIECNRPEFVGQHDILIGVSQFVQRWLMNRYQVSAERVLGIIHGADCDTFSPRPGYDIPLGHDEPLRALYVGRITPEKGVDLAIEAVRKLRQVGVAVELTIAGAKWWHGENESDPYVRQIAAAAHCAQVKIAGLVPRSELPALMRNHDVLIMPSRWDEPCGLVQFEAMASGLAVIASNRGGIPETLDGNGFLADPNRSESFEAALRSLVIDPGLLASTKRAARKRALERTWDAVVDELEAAFDTSVASSSVRAA